MAIYPGAKKRLIPKWNKTKITRWRRMNLHVAVSESSSLYAMFSRSNSACSHFYVAKDGAVEQYIDTNYRSASDYHGNDSTISVETQGGVRNPDGEPWTEAQVKALAKLWAWARDEHGIKNQMAKNTQTNDNSSGLSWHRLGVEGNFKGRGGILEVSYKPGGIKYSTARGKICPGDAKILQIDDIFKLANGKTPVSKPKPEATKPQASKPKPVASKKNVVSAKTLKTRLKNAGFYHGAINDKEDASLDKAIKAYQKAQVWDKLLVDGYWGQYVENHFQYVLRLQKAMNEWRSDLPNLIADGSFGNLSLRKVRELQTRNKKGAYWKAGGRVVDGIPGPIFAKMLGISYKK